jgi:hypothetical protein
MPNRLPYYIPGNYTPASQLPTRPGWYFCQLADRCLCYLYWPGNWGEVSYWVELPPFIEAALSQIETPATHPAISAESAADSVADPR